MVAVVGCLMVKYRREIVGMLFFEVLFADYDGSGYTAIRSLRTRRRWEEARGYDVLESEVLLAAWPRSGTHVSAMLLLQLVAKNGTFNDFGHLHEVVPMLEFDLGPLAPVLGNHTPYPGLGRRVLMTHEPEHSVAQNLQGKILVVYRDPVATATSLASWIRDDGGDLLPTADDHLRSHRYLGSRGHGFCEWVSAWYQRSLDDPDHIITMNYDAIVHDKRNAVHTIAAFLGLDTTTFDDDDLFADIARLTSYEYMVQQNYHRFNPTDFDITGRSSLLRQSSQQHNERPRFCRSFPTILCDLIPSWTGGGGGAGKKPPPQKRRHPLPDPATVTEFKAFCRPILEKVGFPVADIL